MTDIRTTPRRKVLVSGASVAGPTLAFWLSRHGYDVTVVERAGTIRAGGYPIDVRGTALEVVRRMGVLPRLREAHIDLRRLTFLSGDGGEVASVHPHNVTGGVAGHDLEVRRGDLTEALYDAVRDDVEFVFDDCVETLDQSGGGVDVTFRGGGRRTYDMVFSAEGMHSRTRELVFGPEEPFHRYLGYCFAVFTMRNTFGLSHETVMWNTPGRAAALYATGDHDDVHAFLNFALPEPPFDAFGDPEAQRKLVASVFADAGWEVPAMLAAMRDADDVFFDAVAQIRMPRWSSGRVAVVGDAAHAPSLGEGRIRHDSHEADRPAAEDQLQPLTRYPPPRLPRQLHAVRRGGIARRAIDGDRVDGAGRALHELSIRSEGQRARMGTGSGEPGTVGNSEE